MNVFLKYFVYNSYLLIGKQTHQCQKIISFAMSLPTALYNLNFRDVETRAQQGETTLAQLHVHTRLVSCTLNVHKYILKHFLLYISTADSAKGVHITKLHVLSKKLFRSMFSDFL